MDSDPEKWADARSADDDEDDDNLEDDFPDRPTDIQPKFFRTPSVDLIPSASAIAAAAARRKSSIKSDARKQSTTAEARRRSFAQSPLKSISSPVGAFRGISETVSDGQSVDRELDAEERIRLADLEEQYHRLAEPDEQETIRFGGPYSLQDLKDELKGLCTLKTLQRKIPITAWLPKYNCQDLLGDLVAGLTVSSSNTEPFNAG